MKKLMITAACAFAAGILSAQDMSVPTAVEQAGGGDDGVKAVAVAESDAKELNASRKTEEKFIPAQKIVDERLKKLKVKLRKEKRNKGVYFGTGVAKWRFENPATDKFFNDLRSAKAVEALLSAKAMVIESIKTSVDVFERSCAMRIDESDPVAKAYADQKNLLETKRRELATKMRELNQAEADEFQSTTITAKFGSILDALAKKLDKDFDAGKIPAEKKALVKQLTAECKAMQSEFASLKKVAEKFAPQVDQENTSTVKSSTEMHLLGSTIVAQAESWNEKTKEYQMAIAVVWSLKLQEEATAITEGRAEKSTPGKYSPEEWADAQNFEVMIGPRTFTDSEGNKIFVGIASADLECPFNQQRLLKRAAAAVARGYIATAIGCEIKSATEVQQTIKEYSVGVGDTVAGISKKLSDEIVSSSHKELTGSKILFEDEFIHPLSGRNTYVCAFYIDPEDSNSAMEVLTSAYAAACRQDAANKRKAGIHQGAKDVYEEQRRSKVDFERGRAEGKSATINKSQKKQLRSSGARGGTSSSSAGAKGGSYSGDSDIDTDF